MSGTATIGALNVVMSVDTAEYQDGLTKAQASLAKLSKAAAAMGVAIGAAMAAAGAAVAVAVKGSIDAADELSKASQKVGVGVKALSELKYAAELSDVSLGQLQVGLKKLSQSMVAAASDTDGKAAEAFKSLGVSVTDASGQMRDTDAVFADLAGGFAGVHDGATKTALAVQLFGKSGSDMIPLLNSGKDGLAQMAAEANTLGVVIDEKTGKAAENFNDNLTRLKTVGSGLSTQLASALLPALVSVTDGLVVVAKNTSLMNGLGVVLSGVLRGLATAGVLVAGQFAQLGNSLRSVVGAIGAVLQGQFGKALDVLEQGVRNQVKIAGTTAASIRTIWTQAGAQAAAVAPKVGEQLAAPIDEGAKRASAARKSLESDADKAAKAIRAYLASEQSSLAQTGLSQNEVKAREAMAKAHEAYLAGLTKEAKELGEIAAAYRAGDVELKKLTGTQGELLQITRAFQPELETGWGSFRRGVEEAEDAFRRTEYAVEDLFYSIRSNDWVGAFGGLRRAIDQIKTAFDTAASSGARMAAAAGAASAIGGAIGGTAGSAISGAAGGFMTGNKILPGIGGIIGGVLGGLGGLLGASKAKKRAKREAAERARLEAERKAAELAAAKRALELRLMELSGDEAVALAARRADELKAMDASLQALQQEVWAKEDAAEAARKAAQLVADTRAIEIQKLEALGRAEEALAMIRADELAALSPELRELQQSLYDVIDATNAAEAAQQRLADIEAAQADRVADAESRVASARQDVAEAIRNEIGELENIRSTFAGLADDLAAFGRELAGGELGGVGLRGQLAAAQAAFDAVKGKTDAESLARLPELGRALISAQAAVAPDSRALARTVDEVRRATSLGEAAARGQVSSAERQIAGLNATAAALGVLNEGVLNLRAAEDRLADAVIFQSGVMREAAAAIAQAAAGVDQALAAVAQVANSNAAPIATAADSLAASALAIESSLGVGAAAADGAESLVAAAIAEELKPALTSIAMASDRQASLLKRWDGNGMPEVRDVG